MIDVKTAVTGPVETNCYIVTSGDESLVIDPGGSGKGLLEACAGLNITAVLCTHGHADHFAGYPSFKQQGIPLWTGAGDAPMLLDAEKNLSLFTGMVFSLEEPADMLLSEGDTFTLGGIEFSVLALPGHTDGSIGLYAEGHLFCGDVLFQDSVGRTDLPGGDFQILRSTIQQKLFTLPGKTRVYPGHGPQTTIAYEKTHNPYVRVED